MSMMRYWRSGVPDTPIDAWTNSDTSVHVVVVQIIVIARQCRWNRTVLDGRQGILPALSTVRQVPSLATIETLLVVLLTLAKRASRARWMFGPALVCAMSFLPTL